MNLLTKLIIARLIIILLIILLTSEKIEHMIDCEIIKKNDYTNKSIYKEYFNKYNEPNINYCFNINKMSLYSVMYYNGYCFNIMINLKGAGPDGTIYY